MNKRQQGGIGEDIAAKYLQKQGYKILQRNYFCHFGEIDIVAQDGAYIVFVEVKARTSYAFGAPREAVDWRKQQTIVQCAKLWLTANGKYGAPVRFDVVEVMPEQVTLFRDAFRC